MEPAALWEEMEHQGMDYRREDSDCIMALRTAIRSNSAWKDWNVFFNTVAAFNGLEINPESLPELTPSQLAWGIKQLKRIDEKDIFSASVCMAIAGIVFEYGICWIPDTSPLAICKPYLQRILWQKICEDETLEALYDKMEEGYFNPASCITDTQRIHSEKLHIIDEYLNLGEETP
jgi:hypothetical protein